MSAIGVQDGNTMDYTNAGGTAINVNDVVLVGAMVGVAHATIAASGGQGVLTTTGVYQVKCTAADTPAQGALAYWNNTAKEFTTTASGNTLAGKFWAAKAATVGVGFVKINV